MILIAGLGNPGKDYENTRHNIGFVVADRLLDDLAVQVTYYKFNAEVFESDYSGKKLLIVRPLLYMNNSGASLKHFITQYSLEIDRILVIHDDIDIDFGKIRLKTGGGTGGHNGLESLVKHMGNADFDRLRFGVGRPPKKIDPAVYVLSRFKRVELKNLFFIVDKAVTSIKDYIEFGIDYAMNKYNN
ncbi:MAG: aminoacyl-tRNA hydrolase [Actinobacteria bacterium]|nr:aminoacyl-tRNA hydrolase [Actinomycetota bacterium]